MLSRADVAEIAHLARLELSDDEIEALREELSTILSHVQALDRVDTSSVEPMTHAVPMALRLREDQVEPSLPVERAMKDAPASSDDCFQVPHILDSSS